MIWRKLLHTLVRCIAKFITMKEWCSVWRVDWLMRQSESGELNGEWADRGVRVRVERVWRVDRLMHQSESGELSGEWTV